MDGTIVIATLYIVLGGISALLGFKLFKLLLPIIGLLAGMAAGYQAVIGWWGSGVFSFTAAIITAFVVGLVFALLSYFFFELAVVLIGAALGGSALAYLGVVLGLSEDGFITFLLALTGAILAAVLVMSYGLSRDLVLVWTSFVGVGLVMVGLMLIFGDLSLEKFHEQGLSTTVMDIVDDSFIWFLVWFGGSMVASYIQASTSKLEFYDDRYAFESKK